jgi:WD40 repeat protein
MIRWLAAMIVALSVSSAAVASPALKFVRQIGVGWDPAKFSWMNFVAFDPTGRLIVSDGPSTPGKMSEGLSFWSFPEGKLVKTSKTQGALSPDWRYVAGPHGVTRLIDGREVLAVADDVYADYVFSPDSRYVAETATGAGRTGARGVRVVELHSGKVLRTFGRGQAASATISPDDRMIATGHWNLVVLWDMATGRRLASLRGEGRYVSAMSFSPNGRSLAIGTDGGLIQVWDVRRRKMIGSHQLDGGFPSTPSFSPDGRLLVVGTYGSGTVWLIDARTGKVVDHQRVSDLGCGSAAFSPDGRYVITPSTGGLIKWPYDRGGTVRVFRVVMSKPHRHPPA